MQSEISDTPDPIRMRLNYSAFGRLTKQAGPHWVPRFRICQLLFSYTRARLNEAE